MRNAPAGPRPTRHQAGYPTRGPAHNPIGNNRQIRAERARLESETADSIVMQFHVRYTRKYGLGTRGRKILLTSRKKENKKKISAGQRKSVAVLQPVAHACCSGPPSYIFIPSINIIIFDGWVVIYLHVVVRAAVSPLGLFG